MSSYDEGYQIVEAQEIKGFEFETPAHKERFLWDLAFTDVKDAADRALAPYTQPAVPSPTAGVRVEADLVADCREEVFGHRCGRGLHQGRVHKCGCGARTWAK